MGRKVSDGGLRVEQKIYYIGFNSEKNSIEIEMRNFWKFQHFQHIQRLRSRSFCKVIISQKSVNCRQKSRQGLQ